MDDKIFKYKKALAVDFYVLTPGTESLKGNLKRNQKRGIYRQHGRRKFNKLRSQSQI